VNISIVSGCLPLAAECSAVALLVVSVDWRTGRWRRQIGGAASIAVVLTGLAALVLTPGSPVSDSYSWPAQFWGLVFRPALGPSVLGWRHAGKWRRAAVTTGPGGCSPLCVKPERWSPMAESRWSGERGWWHR
jgi:hypothetical protein